MQGANVIIIGGGFYGLSIAQYLREQLGIANVTVLEKEPAMMQHASYNNQARIHNGYHYPRSVLTSLRSRINFPRFVEDYSDSVVSDFTKYYGVARKLSKVTARQFEEFCRRIGAEIEPASKDVLGMFDPNLVDGVFKVKEYAFDSVKLRNLLLKRIGNSDIDLRNNVQVETVKPAGSKLVVETNNGTFQADSVINCSYANINKLHESMGVDFVPLKYELTEMCLVDLPQDLKDFSITMMDGPFFSVMPFPDRGLHTLSHVRYTPHTEWTDKPGEPVRNGYELLAQDKPRTNFRHMYADMVRYIPALKNIVHADSLWEVKTILTRSEGDDSRPILFRANHGIPGYTCIMGGKLDNIYDAFGELNLLYGQKA